MSRLRALIAEKNLRFRERFQGTELSAVSLHTAAGEATKALTDNFLEVELDARIAANQALRVLVTGLSGNGLNGRIAA